MATLKSFELKGNKLSFANWISNLSPTATPFTSMIGKEGIDQTQYTWQTDSLAPASSETFSEGSQAVMQPRASTKTFTNFTTIFRRAVKVSDTNQATHAYGRRDELVYQIGKAGESILRDIEFVNLGSQKGRSGSATQSSLHTGFKGLCTPLYTPDPDTFAITHQGVAVVDPKQPWFALKDIFRLTTDLFLSGSKADKIMFHPKHMNIFSAHIGYNEEEPLIFRMFDDLSDKYNAKVTKIKDPLGRVYTLIPNRFMPEKAIYFFTEADWTQVILQEPQRKKISKTGSSSQTMIEAEVGLRHKHPSASGVLDLFVVKYTAKITPSKTKMTAYVDDDLSAVLSVKNLDGSAAGGVNVKLKVSPDNVFDLHTDEVTTGPNGEYYLDGSANNPGRVVFYGYNDEEGKELLTNPVTVEVVPPAIEFKLVGNKNPQVYKQSELKVSVKRADGSPVRNTPTYIFTDEGNEVAGLSGNKFTTDNEGVATVHFTPTKICRLNFRAQMYDYRGDWTSYPYQLEVEDNAYLVTFAADTKKTLTLNVDGTQSVSIKVTEDGQPVSGATVKVSSSNKNAVDFLSGEYGTNADGIATTQMSVVGIGTSTITATYLNKRAEVEVHVGTGSVTLTIDKPVIEIGDQVGATATAQLIGADGSIVEKAGVQINWGSEPDELKVDFSAGSSTTNDKGVASITITDEGVVAKGIVEAYWTTNDAFGAAKFEVIPTQIKASFDQKEINVVGGLGDEIEISAKVSHPWATLSDHILTYSSDNADAIYWKEGKGTTDDTGYVVPINSIIASSFGKATLSVVGTNTDVEVCEPGYMVVTSHKPVASMTATYTELLIDDVGEITLTLEQPEAMGGSSIPYTGNLIVLADKGGIETSETLSMVTGRATINYKALKVGKYPITIALEDGTILPSRHPLTITVSYPGISITTIPEKYTMDELVIIRAHLSKPVGSTANLKDRTVTFYFDPDSLDGVSSGNTATTDANGMAEIRTTNIKNNSDFEITASFNGVTSEVYILSENV